MAAPAPGLISVPSCPQRGAWVAQLGGLSARHESLIQRAGLAAGVGGEPGGWHGQPHRPAASGETQGAAAPTRKARRMREAGADHSRSCSLPATRCATRGYSDAPSNSCGLEDEMRPGGAAIATARGQEAPGQAAPASAPARRLARHRTAIGLPGGRLRLTCALRRAVRDPIWGRNPKGGGVTHLLSRLPIPDSQVITINPQLPVEEAAEDYAKKLRQAFQGDAIPVFDLLILGVGPDGHTCSLFPDHPLLQEREKIVAPISDSPKPPPERVTLTLPVLNAARTVIFVATGEGKAAVLKRILEAKEENPLPAALVQPHTGKLCWFLDEAAARLLTVPFEKHSTL
ncbi:6-phosphogluconolactonase [Puma concolor]|uniref:6-phosphogluconolactonase n=1 Tax=Puma concolor TaxID=9696 RepID=A0A6P6H7G8_PUMCO|nr:6-phosphogluconolactonase [Puma concolor]